MGSKWNYGQTESAGKLRKNILLSFSSFSTILVFTGDGQNDTMWNRSLFRTFAVADSRTSVGHRLDVLSREFLRYKWSRKGRTPWPSGRNTNVLGAWGRPVLIPQVVNKVFSWRWRPVQAGYSLPNRPNRFGNYKPVVVTEEPALTLRRVNRRNASNVLNFLYKTM